MSADGQSVREAGELISFVDRADGDGFSIVDHVGRRRCVVKTADPVNPKERPVNETDPPVDRIVSVTTRQLSIPHAAAYVRRQDGTPIVEIMNGDERAFSEGRYRIELTTAIKLYVVVESGFEIAVTEDGLAIDFGGSVNVSLGARTDSNRPAATVTTTDDPADLMRAVSSFGSALNTTSCERSYPTLRGHPPAIEHGDEVSVPDVLDLPETGVTIQIPPEYGAIYAVSSLAYYLGATVVPGKEPLIETETGFVHLLDDDGRGFEGEVERVLKQCFFLDCITRTEGLYPVDLHEREQIEADVDLDFSRLYGRPLADQVETYLQVPYTVIEPHVPRWRFTVHIQPVADSAKALPYVARDLAAIRSKKPVEPAEGVTRSTASLGIDEFVRSGGSDQPDCPDRNGRGPAVRIDDTDAFEDVWVGSGVPVGATKGMVEAFRNHVTRSPSDGDIDITVVVNDDGMTEESRDVNGVYGSRDALPFDITVAEQLTTEELKQVLKTETDFLHYIGHIDKRGFECPDGIVDAGELNETGVDAFFLNACNSYRQGKSLIRAGSIAGVVTLTPVPNEEAAEMGRRLARLLDFGFPLYAALDVASTGQTYNNYTAIGSSSLNIVQPEGGVANLCEIKNTLSNKYEISYITYLTGRSLLGAITSVTIQSDEYFLTSGMTGEFKLKKSKFVDFLNRWKFPIIKKNSVYWDHNNIK